MERNSDKLLINRLLKKANVKLSYRGRIRVISHSMSWKYINDYMHLNDLAEEYINDYVPYDFFGFLNSLNTRNYIYISSMFINDDNFKSYSAYYKWRIRYGVKASRNEILELEL